jgi:hypothetical protein
MGLGTWIALAVAGGTALVCAPAVPGGSSALRPLDLLEHPDRYLNQRVEVEIVESLGGPTTPAALAGAEYGQVEVRIPDGGTATLSLVPAGFDPADANRYRRKFDRVLKSPLRVRGELLRDAEMSAANRRPAYVIRVASIEALDLGSPVRVPSLAALAADPARWDRRLIVYEGGYRSGFEISSLDGEIWLETGSETEVIGGSRVGPGGIGSRRVRVTGVLFAKAGAHYGHMGGSKYQLTASKLEYLPHEPANP